MGKRAHTYRPPPYAGLGPLPAFVAPPADEEEDVTPPLPEEEELLFAELDFELDPFELELELPPLAAENAPLKLNRGILFTTFSTNETSYFFLFPCNPSFEEKKSPFAYLEESPVFPPLLLDEPPPPLPPPPPPPLRLNKSRASISAGFSDSENHVYSVEASGFASRAMSSLEGMYCGFANEGVEERSSRATVQRCDLIFIFAGMDFSFGKLIK